MFGLLALSNGSPGRTSLAQDQELCSTPGPMGADLDIYRIGINLDGTDSDVSVQDVRLAAGESVSVLAGPSTLLFVAGGSDTETVTLTVCEGDTVGVTPWSGSGTVLVTGPATKQLNLADTVTVTSTVRYYLTGVAPESQIVLTVIPFGGGGLCGGAGC